MDPNNPQGNNPYNNPYAQQPQNPFQQGYQPASYSETTAGNAFNYGPTGKARGVYAIFAIVLGSIGLHYFYTGKVAGGIITILLVLVTCGLWAIIPVIQGILAFWSMSNEQFYYNHVATTSVFPLF